jgi:hypothetical protein
MPIWLQVIVAVVGVVGGVVTIFNYLGWTRPVVEQTVRRHRDRASVMGPALMLVSGMVGGFATTNGSAVNMFFLAEGVVGLALFWLACVRWGKVRRRPADDRDQARGGTD